MTDNRQGGFGFGDYGSSSRYGDAPAVTTTSGRGGFTSPRGGSGYQQGAKPEVKPLQPIGGRWTEAELVAMVPELLAIRQGAAFGEDAFAGIGSRETPQDVQDEMGRMTREMESRGFRLRSGGADGADDAFEKGSTAGNKEIFLPKAGFNGRSQGILLRGEQYRRAQEMAMNYHPNPDALFYDGNLRRKPKFAAEAHTRNMGQMLGANLDRPSKVVLCYTPDGAASGGTGQAIRVAEALGVPVLNMRRPAIREAVLKELGIERVQERQQVRGMDAARDAARSRGPAAQEVRGGGKPFDFEAIAKPEQRWDKRNASVFLKTTEKFGELSNMARGHAYRDGDVEWPSTEAQFQAMKFPDHPEIQEAIRAASNAKLAKDVAYEHQDKVRPDWQDVNLHAMAYVLTRKHDASPSFRAALTEAASGGRTIVEWSRKSTFWGAAPDGSSLLGQNVLGRMLNQLEAGARMDDLPPGTRLIGRETVVAAPARGEVSSTRPVGSPQQAVVEPRYRPGADVSRMSADVIVNTVNANLSKASQDGSRQDGNPVMGAGVAKAFKERYGDAILRPYAQAIRNGALKAGGVQMLTMPDGQVVANLATKQDWRDPSRIEWVESGLAKLAAEMKAAGHRSVALPPPGCGNGGLDWKDVEPLVLKHLKDFDVTITAAPSNAVGTGRGGEQSRGVESRSGVLQAARDEARWRGGREERAQPAAEPQMRTSMYFSYGRSKRQGVEASTTFEAILSGERTSTTRFDNWQGSDRWGRLKPGAVVRMFEDREMKGRHVDVRVTGVERIDLAKCSDERLEDWSKAEGWSPQAGRDYGAKNQPGWQVRYEPVPGQEILKERERGGDRDGPSQVDLMSVMRGNRYGR